MKDKIDYERSAIYWEASQTKSCQTSLGRQVKLIVARRCFFVSLQLFSWDSFPSHLLKYLGHTDWFKYTTNDPTLKLQDRWYHTEFVRDIKSSLIPYRVHTWYKYHVPTLSEWAYYFFCGNHAHTLFSKNTKIIIQV